MGGTFDPIHVGHLILGEKAYEQLNLDKVWFMPSGNPPHKQNRMGRATDEQRIAMVQKAIAGNPHFELSLIEMHEEGYSYTYRTLESLKKKIRTLHITLSSVQILCTTFLYGRNPAGFVRRVPWLLQPETIRLSRN